MKIYPCSGMERLDITKMSFSSKLFDKFSTIPITNLKRIFLSFVALDNLTPKFIWKNKGTKLTTSIFNLPYQISTHNENSSILGEE